MSQKTPKLVHLSCRFVLSLFEVALRSAAIYDVRGVILVIEDLQQLRLGVVEWVDDQAASLHASLKSKIWANRTELELNQFTFINSLIFSASDDKSSVSNRFNTLFSISISRVSSFICDDKMRKVKKLITRSTRFNTISVISPQIKCVFQPLTRCATFGWLAKSMTLGRRSSRAFTSECRKKWLWTCFHCWLYVFNKDACGFFSTTSFFLMLALSALFSLFTSATASVMSSAGRSLKLAKIRMLWWKE